VDDAAYVKAAFLSDIAHKKISCELISQKEATFYLGTMLGGYNVEPLI
jgi:aconitate hydratase 2/2-methylisocitrate dehydratase